MDNDIPVIPWGVALLLFKYQLLTRLQKDFKLSRKEAVDLLANSRNKEESRIKSILDELTHEDPKRT